MSDTKVAEFWAVHGGDSMTERLHQMVSSTKWPDDVVKQAFVALTITPDYATAARAAGWYFVADESEWRRSNSEASDGYDYANSAETACRMDGNPAFAVVSVEHPVVSEQLAGRLERYGERVFEVAGTHVWMKDAGVSAVEHPVIAEIASAHGHEMSLVITAVGIARSHGYSVETWETFVSDADLPEDLLARAQQIKAECEGRDEVVTHVLFDKNDNDEGFLILGNDPEEMCFELCDGPLENDERWSGLIRPSTGFKIG